MPSISTEMKTLRLTLVHPSGLRRRFRRAPLLAPGC
jgi:hypothetical protein